VRAAEHRDADRNVGELLRRLDLRVGTHDKRRERHDRATTDLAAADLGGLNARIVAPFAGVVEIGLALLHHLAVAIEAAGVLVAGDVHLGALVDALLAVHPFDLDAFLLEQALGIRDELGQSLEWRCRFQS
jgi:hypothetical protein